MSDIRRHERCLSPARAADWLDRADRALRRAALRTAPDADFVPTASSLRLTAWTELPWVELWPALADTPAVGAARAALGGPLAICASQSWLRRQYPPALAPPLHHAHQWHQDSALGWRFDLQAPQRPPPADALLSMQTLWIALTDCGIDAPALQWVDAPQPGLQPLSALSDDAVQAAATGPMRAWPLQAGDALRFDGALLHRTQPAAGMPHVRSSVELRLFRDDARPPRLLGERWIAVG